MKQQFKVGDIVELNRGENGKVKGKDYSSMVFLGVVTDNMIKFINSNNTYKIEYVDSQLVQFEGCNYLFKKEWFRKVKDRNEVVNIKFIKNNNETLAIINDEKIGKTVRNPQDKNDDNIGMIIALLRALNVKKHIENTIIDVLYGETVGLNFVTNEELLKEVKKRMW